MGPVTLCGQSFDDDAYSVTIFNCNEQLLPNELGRLDRLTNLEIYGGVVSTIPATISNLRDLESITIENNHLTSLPQQLFSLPVVNYINIAGNNFTSLGWEGGSVLTQLTTLIAKDNQLADVDTSFYTGRWSLVNLDLANNDLSSLHRRLTRLGDLEYLNLENNEFASLPTQLGELYKLRTLNLEKNGFTSIPTQLGELNRLTHALFIGKELQYVPSELALLTKLNALELGPVPCDCQFLSWFGDLVQASFITDPFRSAQCNGDNEYEGSFPHLLRSDANAPCSHPRFVGNLTATTTNATMSWTYPALTPSDTTLLATPAPDLGASSASFRDCSPVTLGAPIPTDAYLGFAVSFDDIAIGGGAPERRECYSATELLDINSGNFVLTLEELLPASTYDLSIRPFRFEFVPVEGIISYKFGIATNNVRFRTADVTPVNAPRGAHVVNAGARELTISWSEIEGSIGEIIEYEVELMDPSTGSSVTKSAALTSTTFRLIGFGQQLEDDTRYIVRVRGRTLSPEFGPFSDWANVSTCPLNMAFDISQGDECFSLIGYFTFQGRAISCTTLPGQLLRDGGCDRDGIDVSDIPMGAGSWRPSLESLQISKCPEPSFCMHSYNLFGVNQYCSENHQGVYCFECLPGYALATEGCVPCDNTNLAQSEAAIGLGVVMFLLLLLAFAVKLCLAAGFKLKPSNNRRSEVVNPRHGSVGSEGEEKNEEALDEEPQVVTVSAMMQEEHDEENGGPLPFPLGKSNSFAAKKVGGMSEENDDENCDGNGSGHRPTVATVRMKSQSVESERRTFYSMQKGGMYASRMELIHTSIRSFLGTAEYTDAIPKTTVSVKVQIFFGFNQVIFAYGRILTTRAVPNSLAGVIGFFTYVDISAVFAEFRFRCIYDFDHYDDLVLRTMSPILLISLVYLCNKWMASLRPEKREKLHRTFVSSFLLILFVIYPSVSQVIFETFWCEQFNTPLGNISSVPELDLTTMALKTDYRLSCANRDGWLAYALVMVALYPIGVVLIYCYYLYSFKDTVRKKFKTVLDKQRLIKVSFLVEPYKSQCFWFEAYELIRKVLQTSLVGFFQEDHQLMTFLAATLCLPAVTILVFFQPYKKQVDNAFAFVSLLVLAAAIQFSTDERYKDAGAFLDVMVPAIYAELGLFGAVVLFDLGRYALELRHERAKGNGKEARSVRSSLTTLTERIVP